MYHCNLQIYLVGHNSETFNIIKEMPPLERFAHTFTESDMPDSDMALNADVIFVDVTGWDERETVRELVAAKRESVALIVVANHDQIGLLTEELPDLADIWTLPMTKDELRFRFLRFQQRCKQDKDFWLTSYYLDAVTDSSPNFIWFRDKNGVYERVNIAFCRAVKEYYSRSSEDENTDVADGWHSNAAYMDAVNREMNRLDTTVSEEVIRLGENGHMFVSYKASLYDFDGSLMGTSGVTVDVTRERVYEKDVLDKNRTLETIFATLDCGIMSHTLDGSRVIDVNPAALEILGYNSKEELEADNFNMVAETVVDEDKPILRKAIKDLKPGGNSVNVEYRVRNKDGRLRHVMGSIKLVSENGMTFCQRFLLDCTDRKNKEIRREWRQEQLMQALSADYNQVCHFDFDTGEGYAMNAHVCRYGTVEGLFDKSRPIQDDMDRYINQCVCEEDRDMMRQRLSPERLTKDLREKRSFAVNYRTNCAGHTHYFQMKAVRVGNWNENRVAVLGFRNIDEEVKSDIERRNLLENALIRANQASEAKSAFLSNMSHDIRTPMNAIIGFTALAIDNIDQIGLVKEYLKKIQTSGNHLLSLINDVLDMSRIESGKVRLVEAPCSLPDILHGLRNIVQTDVHAKQLDLYMDAVDVVHENICCDKLRLNQVLLNLLSNSVKYTGKGGTVSVHVIEKPDAPVGYASYEFHIKDTGTGMSKEFVEHIFEPFEREQTSTVSGIQGTGLGMSIVKNIVDMMNGSVEVKSEQGIGTEFIVRLMFRLCDDAQEEQLIPELKNCRALVVDDDFNTCDSVTHMLQQIGMRAEWTMSGREALLRIRQANVRKDAYGVYIIDWLLPDMNGVEIARSIRKEMGENVPIIVITAYDWTDIEDDAKSAGVSIFCGKPLFQSELRHCLSSVVRKAEVVAEEQPVHKRSGRILMAEDNEMNREIGEALLRKAGFSVDTAENGQIAVDMIQNSESGYYQLILMDVQMPVMDGYEASRAIRALPDKALSSIPIVAMTANAFEEDKRKAIENGMNGHIAKPINVKEMLDTLDTLLS